MTLARYDQSFDLLQIGKVLAASGFFDDAKSEARAIVKVLAGQELGFGPIAAMTGIHVIKGKVSIGANLIAARIKGSGKYNYRVRQHTDTICEIEFFEQGESIGVSTFTKDDAKKMGTQNMDKFPRNMLFARAISNGAKWYCPDVFGGPIYTPDELGAELDADGDVVKMPEEPHQSVRPSPKPELEVLQAPETPAKRQAILKRIDDLWVQERDLGYDNPREELDLDPEAMTDEALIALGKTIRARLDSYPPHQQAA